MLGFDRPDTSDLARVRAQQQLALEAHASNARDSSPFGRAPGPFGSLRGNASAFGAPVSAKPREEPAEIFVWDARFGSPGKDEERS